MCIEINAHSLIGYIRTLRDEIEIDGQHFLPWMLGSQSCEKMFRALRSMTGTFSAIVNFTLLGMLHRLHKLSIMQECQSQTGEAQSIHFPRQERYGRKKEGYKNSSESDNSVNISNEDIGEAMKRGLSRANEMMVQLGMAQDLKDSDSWGNTINPTSPYM